MSEDIKLKITADSRDAEQNLKKVSDGLDDVGTKSKKAGKDGKDGMEDLNKGFTAAKVGLVALAAVVAKGIKDFSVLDDSTGRLNDSLKKNSKNVGDYSKVYNELRNNMNSAGVSILQQQNGLQRLIDTSGNVQTSLQDLSLAIKIGRQDHMDLTATVEILRKVRNGEVEEVKNLTGINKDLAASLGQIKDPAIRISETIKILTESYKDGAAGALSYEEKINKLDAQMLTLSSSVGRAALAIGSGAGSFVNSLANAFGLIKDNESLWDSFVSDTERLSTAMEHANVDFDSTSISGQLSTIAALQEILRQKGYDVAQTKAMIAENEEYIKTGESVTQVLNRMNKAQKAYMELTGSKLYVPSAGSKVTDNTTVPISGKGGPTKKGGSKTPKSKPNIGAPINITEEEVADFEATSGGGFAFTDEDSANFDKKQAAIQKAADEELKIKKELSDKLKTIADENAAYEDKLSDDRLRKSIEAEQRKVDALRAGADAAVTLAEVAGAGESELAIMKGAIQVAESIASFASFDYAGGIGHAASATAFFAAAGKGGASGGGGAASAKKKDAEVQAQRDKQQKENTMALKEAFSDALKESNQAGRNITYVINQSGTYLGNDNTSLIKIKETLDGTQRLQFN